MQRKNNSPVSKKENTKKFNLSKKRFAVVVSEFNSDITYPMKDGAIETLKKHGATDSHIDIIYVPGAFEIPLACLKLATKKYKNKKYDGIVVLGCVIKGDTDHYYYVAGEASRGVMQVMMQTGMPIGFGIITVNTLEQAIIRSKGEMNKGVEAAKALMQMVGLF